MITPTDLRVAEFRGIIDWAARRKSRRIRLSTRMYIKRRASISIEIWKTARDIARRDKRERRAQKRFLRRAGV